jgi:hypothetical protein
MGQQDEAPAALATRGHYFTPAAVTPFVYEPGGRLDAQRLIDIDTEHHDRRPVPTIAASDAELEDAVNYILDDCFFAVGQAVGRRKSVDHTAIIWWRDHFHTTFLRTLKRAGNTWVSDRSRVTAVGGLLGARAVSHAGDRPSIDLASAMRAAADVEKYCTIRATRRSRVQGVDRAEPDDAPVMYAGYWCAP